MKKAVVFALTGIMAVSMFGCGSKKQVEVSSVDDLKDLTIGVQTGTIGDDYASDAVANDSQMMPYRHLSRAKLMLLLSILCRHRNLSMQMMI